jgi:hypothetical protein
MSVLNMGNADAANSIIKAAFQMSSQDDFATPSNDNVVPENEEVEETETEEVEESVEEEVDNNGTEDETQNDDEDYEPTDEEGEESDEEVEEDEPEDETYDSGYTYYDENLKKKVFLKAVGEDGKGSIYLNRQEAEKGLARQLAYIKELESRADEIKKRYEDDLLRMKKDMQIYEMTAKPDQIRAGLIADKMPEKFRNVDPKTLGETEYEQYRAARIDAEISVDREIRKAQDDAEKAATDAAAAQKRAEDHIKSRLNDTTFFGGLTNTEDRYVINKRLKEIPEGSQYTYHDMAIEIAKVFGNAVADKFLKASVEDIASSVTTPNKLDSKSNTEAPKKKSDKVEQLKKKVKVKRVAANSGGGNKTPLPADPRQLINMAFAANKK